MDSLKEEYDDLNNLFDNLKIAAKECDNETYRNEILEIMRDIQKDIEDIEPIILKQEISELKEQLEQDNKGRI